MIETSLDFSGLNDIAKDLEALIRAAPRKAATPQRWFHGQTRVTLMPTRWSRYLSRRWWRGTASISWK